MKRNIDHLIHAIDKAVWNHELTPGCFARWRIDDGTGRDMGSSEYGCADAANIFYTIGHFHREPAYRAACVAELQRFQHPDGTFAEPTHHMLHGSAHCVAALELFGAVCCLAELQLALPGEIISSVPLKNVLDRRPFI